MDSRKQKEADFHNMIRDEALEGKKAEFENLTSNRKFYSITRLSDDFVNDWIRGRCKDKKVLDYCCGNGGYAISFAKNGADAVGIDISDVSIKNCKSRAQKEGIGKNVAFYVMDAEATEFPDNTFDVVTCLGVLHHLDTGKAFKEIARILKPDGEVICNEPLAYNPAFQLYRKMTPHLRTEWEMHHILSKKDIDRARKYFNTVDMKFFHLVSMGAVPFANSPLFKPALSILEQVDNVLLRVPLMQWLSWQIVFTLSNPKGSKQL